jgi:hypothetical protein
MLELYVNCPNEENLEEYMNFKISVNEMKALEEHFATCNLCIDRVRRYIEMEALLYSIKPHTDFGKAYKSMHIDAALFPAAASEKNKDISEAKSKDGRYTIRLIPFLYENKAILEIQVMQKDIRGYLIVENNEEILCTAQIIDGFARNEVQTPIDLRNIYIRVQTEDNP